MAKEILIDHDKIQDPQTITQVVTNEMKARDLDVHRHEVEVIDDDYKKGVRKLRVKNTMYFQVPELPWHKASSK